MQTFADRGRERHRRKNRLFFDRKYALVADVQMLKVVGSGDSTYWLTLFNGYERLIRSFAACNVRQF
ncbi:MAG: hypothetical protein KDA81_07810 [Planctomycetaceae bacterium]|nr:hypothetical protein [Planctomycetaceae bacterium]